MTEAGWTREKPTAAGWYWNRISGAVGIALITRRDGRLYAWLKFKDAWLTREGWLDYIHGEWLGPITPDSYQRGRVAGLREAANRLCYLSAQDACSGDVLNEFGWWLKEQVEPQQAQDEKGVGK
jgi:hypothetical protein